MSKLDILLNSDNYLRVSNVRLSADDSTPTISSANAELRDTKGGSAITNSAISLTQVSGQSDQYEGQFPNTVSLTAGQTVYVWVKLEDNKSPSNKTEVEKETVVTTN